jgi:hypothetical protein
MESQAAVEARPGADEAGLADPGDMELLGEYLTVPSTTRQVW